MIKIFYLLHPSVLYFYLRQFWLRIQNRGKLYSKGFRLSWEPMSKFTIEENSKIFLGKNVHVRKGTDLEACDGVTLTIGDNFFINKNSSIVARYGITIGDNCMIGESTSIIDHNHTFDNLSTPFKSQGYVGGKILIGNNVWIAGRVFIGLGVTIGDNVVIGANTIVTKDIPSNSVVYGKIELIVKPLKRDYKENEKNTHS